MSPHISQCVLQEAFLPQASRLLVGAACQPLSCMYVHQGRQSMCNCEVGVCTIYPGVSDLFCEDWEVQIGQPVHQCLCVVVKSGRKDTGVRPVAPHHVKDIQRLQPRRSTSHAVLQYKE